MHNFDRQSMDIKYLIEVPKIYSNMKIFDKRIFVLISFLLFTKCIFAQDSNSTIYCAYLDIYPKDMATMIVVDKTITSGIDYKWINAYVPNLDSTTISNFNQIAKTQSLLGEDCCSDIKNKITVEEFEKIDFHNNSKWKKFAKKFSSRPIIIQFSNIGLNDNQDQAIFEVRMHSYNYLKIELYLMKKQKNGWRFACKFNPVIE